MVKIRRRSRLPRSIQIELLKYFCAGTTARSAAEVTGVNRNTAILFFHKLREVIFEELAASEPGLMGGEIEVDESYFGGRRKGKRGRRCASRPKKGRIYSRLNRAGKFDHRLEAERANRKTAQLRPQFLTLAARGISPQTT